MWTKKLALFWDKQKAICVDNESYRQNFSTRTNWKNMLSGVLMENRRAVELSTFRGRSRRSWTSSPTTFSRTRSGPPVRVWTRCCIISCSRWHGHFFHDQRSFYTRILLAGKYSLWWDEWIDLSDQMPILDPWTRCARNWDVFVGKQERLEYRLGIMFRNDDRHGQTTLPLEIMAIICFQVSLVSLRLKRKTTRFWWRRRSTAGTWPCLIPWMDLPTSTPLSARGRSSVSSRRPRWVWGKGRLDCTYSRSTLEQH